MKDDKDFNNLPDENIAEVKPEAETPDLTETETTDLPAAAPEPEYGTPEYEAKHNPLGIAEEDIWTYRVEGLAAPHINKPFENAKRNKIIFVIVIVAAIILSCYFSISAVAKDTFEYTVLDSGYQLKEFRNTGYITELELNYVLDINYDRESEDSETNYTLVEQTDKPLTSIREYAFNCDEKLQVIRIGANVKELESKSFYTCRALQCIYVDEDNEYYSDVDGVLYNKDKTEIICYPIDHDEYLRNKFGYDEPSEDGPTADYIRDVLTYVIPSTVTKVDELCFNYTELRVVYLPEGLKRVETLGFFKATSLQNIYSYQGASPAEGTYNSLPEGLEYIGSDAFSYNQALTYVYVPASVTHIGHHAFWDCVYKQDGELKGVTEINVARSEEEFKAVKTGDQWLPKYDYLLFNKKVPVNYSAERK